MPPVSSPIRGRSDSGGSRSESRDGGRRCSWLLGSYSLGFFLLALVSLALNAFGPLDVRRKTRVILFGMLVGTLPILVLQVLISTMLVPPSRMPFSAWALSVLALFAIPVSLGYAVVKHRAMEIPALLRRSARYLLVRRGMVTLAILVGLAVTLGFVQLFGRVSALPGDQLSMGLLAGSLFGGLLALAGSASGSRRPSGWTARSSAAPTTRGTC